MHTLAGIQPYVVILILLFVTGKLPKFYYQEPAGVQVRGSHTNYQYMALFTSSGHTVKQRTRYPGTQKNPEYISRVIDFMISYHILQGTRRNADNRARAPSLFT